MFTGLIEETGEIKKLEKIAGGVRLGISGNKIFDDLETDHSVCVCGVCLTVVKIERSLFYTEAVGDTLMKTTLKEYRTGSKVNLERAMRLNDRLGGHLVQGHVNGIATVDSITQRGENWLLRLVIPNDILRYTIEEGSIAVDGISLTIARKYGQMIDISVISHTYRNTIIQYYKSGTTVNIETDFIAKYIENFVTPSDVNKSSKISAEWLKNAGY